MVDDYPIRLDQNAKMAIYVKDIGLPKLSTCYSEVDKMKLARRSQEFLSFSIASDILIKAKETNDMNILNQKNFIKSIT